MAGLGLFQNAQCHSYGGARQESSLKAAVQPENIVHERMMAWNGTKLQHQRVAVRPGSDRADERAWLNGCCAMCWRFKHGQIDALLFDPFPRIWARSL